MKREKAFRAVDEELGEDNPIFEGCSSIIIADAAGAVWSAECALHWLSHQPRYFSSSQPHTQAPLWRSTVVDRLISWLARSNWRLVRLLLEVIRITCYCACSIARTFYHCSPDLLPAFSCQMGHAFMLKGAIEGAQCKWNTTTSTDIRNTGNSCTLVLFIEVLATLPSNRKALTTQSPSNIIIIISSAARAPCPREDSCRWEWLARDSFVCVYLVTFQSAPECSEAPWGKQSEKEQSSATETSKTVNCTSVDKFADESAKPTPAGGANHHHYHQPQPPDHIQCLIFLPLQPFVSVHFLTSFLFYHRFSSILF